MPNVCTALIFSEGEQGETLNAIAIPCLLLLKDPRRGVLINSLASLWSALNSSRVHRHKNVKSFGGTKLCSPPPVIFSPIGTPKTVLYTNSFEFSGEMSSHMIGGYKNKEGCAPLRAAGQSRPCVQPFEEAADVQPPAALPLMCSPPAGARSWPLPSLQHDQK